MAERGPSDEIERVLKEILAPLIHADGGSMYLVSLGPDDVHVHLSGACAGCPGSSFTRDRMLAPIIATAAPKVKLRVTTGWKIPEGARRVE